LLGALLKKQPLPGICAINFNAESASIARIIAGDAKPVVDFCGFYSLDQPTIEHQLRQLATTHQLNRYTCTTLMSRIDYQLLVMEAPAVPKNELKDALRWHIKDLIDEPVSDITLDAFDVPTPRGAKKSNVVYVVAAKKEQLNNRSKILQSAGINLQIIDIKELAQRNIANLLSDNKNGVALLSLDSTSGILTLSRGGELYLNRPLNLGLNQVVPAATNAPTEIQNDTGLPELNLDSEIANSAIYDYIALELQRSLDYYESNFRQPPIRTLHLAPIARTLPGFPEYIKNNLNMNVEVVDLNNLFESKTPIPVETQEKVFFALGAALHGSDHEPGN